MVAPNAYGSSTVKRERRSRAQLDVIEQAIIAAVETEHPVTLRGVYYRVVSAGAVDKTELAYRLVGRELLKLRRRGEVRYADITDGTRWITKPASWDSVESMLDDVSASYRRALWHDQAVEVHLFTEKDAVSGVILPVTERWDVPLGVIRGYTSESFAYSVAQSIKANAAREKHTYVYQVGDHDPSGVDAWRDLQAKVRGFLGRDAVYMATFGRLAVLPDQIAEYQLPTRPTKASDTRAKNFEGGSVEVDAIPPTILRQLVHDAITQHINPEVYRLHQMVESSERAGLQALVGGWSS